MEFIVSPIVKYWGNSMMKTVKIKRHFTLIEMIAVVAIAGALIAMFVPAFSRMMFGSKVDQTASDFKLGLEMAQAKAISTRKYVAMVIPQHFGSADRRLQPYCDGGYRLAFVDRDGHFMGWIPGSSWRNAADGARFSQQVTGLKDLKLDPSVSEDADWDDLGDKNRQAVIFSPYGGVVGNSNVRFSFTEASYTGVGSDSRAEYDFPNKDNKLTLEVNFVTGRVKYKED